MSSSIGKVWLVGAGPGDPELLTLKALRAIENADLILFDQLVGDAIRALFPAHIPAFYVGKVKGHHSIAQDDLNTLLIKKARAGKRVVRVKGGDPFVFGRGGEEMQALVAEGIPVEVVPGVTAASACTTYANIPLTHRGLSQGCTLVTGHAEKHLGLDWEALSRLNHTLVFYMGLSRADVISNNLIAAGMDPATPVAIIENGCRENQRQVIATVADLPVVVVAEAVQSPAIIVIGEVVTLSSQLSQVVAEAGLAKAVAA